MYLPSFSVVTSEFLGRYMFYFIMELTFCKFSFTVSILSCSLLSTLRFSLYQIFYHVSIVRNEHLPSTSVFWNLCFTGPCDVSLSECEDENCWSGYYFNCSIIGVFPVWLLCEIWNLESYVQIWIILLIFTIPIVFLIRNITLVWKCIKHNLHIKDVYYYGAYVLYKCCVIIN